MSPKYFLTALTRSLLVGAALLLLGNVAPAYAADTLGLNPLIIEKTLTPGSNYPDVIKVTNRGAEPVKVRGSVADFMYDANGLMQFVDENEPSVSTASLKAWLNIPRDPFVLQPNETKELEVSVTVPTDAEPGGHYGVLFVNTVPEGEETLKISGRVGTLVLVEVPGDVRKDASLTSFNVGTLTTVQNREVLKAKSSFDSAPVSFEYRVKNTGNVHFTPDGEIVIKNMFGKVVDTISAQPEQKTARFRAFPGVERSFFRTWEPGFLLGKYTAELTVADGSGKKLPVKTVSFTVLPWMFIGGAALTLLILISLIVTLIKRYNAHVLKKAHGHHGHK